MRCTDLASGSFAVRGGEPSDEDEDEVEDEDEDEEDEDEDEEDNEDEDEDEDTSESSDNSVRSLKPDSFLLFKSGSATDD